MSVPESTSYEKLHIKPVFETLSNSKINDIQKSVSTDVQITCDAFNINKEIDFFLNVYSLIELSWNSNEYERIVRGVADQYISTVKGDNEPNFEKIYDYIYHVLDKKIYDRKNNDIIDKIFEFVRKEHAEDEDENGDAKARELKIRSEAREKLDIFIDNMKKSFVVENFGVKGHELNSLFEKYRFKNVSVDEISNKIKNLVQISPDEAKDLIFACNTVKIKELNFDSLVELGSDIASIFAKFKGDLFKFKKVKNIDKEAAKALAEWLILGPDRKIVFPGLNKESQKIWTRAKKKFPTRVKRNAESSLIADVEENGNEYIYSEYENDKFTNNPFYELLNKAEVSIDKQAKNTTSNEGDTTYEFQEYDENSNNILPEQMHTDTGEADKSDSDKQSEAPKVPEAKAPQASETPEAPKTVTSKKTPPMKSNLFTKTSSDQETDLLSQIEIENNSYSINNGKLDLNLLTELSVDDAKKIVGSTTITTLSLNGLTTLDEEVAKALAGSTTITTLNLNGLTTLTKEVAEALAESATITSLNLNGLTTLDEEVAKVLVESTTITTLNLNGLTNLKPEAARELIKSSSLTALYLNQEKINLQSLIILTKINNIDFNTIVNNLNSLDIETAKEIAKSTTVTTINLNGLTTLDKEVVKEIAKSTTITTLNLNGLTTLNEDVAEALTNRTTIETLSLTGLTVLEEEIARVFAKSSLKKIDIDDGILDFKSKIILSKFYEIESMLNSLSELSSDDAKVLVEEYREGVLSLNGLTALIEDAAGELVRSNFIKKLSLNGLVVLEKEVAEKLSSANVDTLYLDGLKSLDAETAKALVESGKIKILHLNGLRSLDVETVQALKGVKTLHLPSEFNFEEAVKNNTACLLNDFNSEDLGKIIKGKVLNLSFLKSLDENKAKEIIKMPIDSLNLNGLNSLDKDTADVLLGASNINFLFLDGLSLITGIEKALAESRHLNTLSLNSVNSVTEKIFEFKGKSLYLNKIGLNPLLINALAKFKGESLFLDGLTDLSSEAAKALARSSVKTLRLNGVTELKTENLASLLKSKTLTILSLNGLKKLTPELAEEFKKSKIKTLFLNGVSELTEATVRSLLNSPIQILYLQGLTRNNISPELAKILLELKKKKTLFISNAINLSNMANPTFTSSPASNPKKQTPDISKIQKLADALLPNHANLYQKQYNLAIKRALNSQEAAKYAFEQVYLPFYYEFDKVESGEAGVLNQVLKSKIQGENIQGRSALQVAYGEILRSSSIKNNEIETFLKQALTGGTDSRDLRKKERLAGEAEELFNSLNDAYKYLYNDKEVNGINGAFNAFDGLSPSDSVLSEEITKQEALIAEKNAVIKDKKANSQDKTKANAALVTATAELAKLKKLQEASEKFHAALLKFVENALLAGVTNSSINLEDLRKSLQSTDCNPASTTFKPSKLKGLFTTHFQNFLSDPANLTSLRTAIDNKLDAAEKAKNTAKGEYENSKNTHEANFNLKDHVVARKIIEALLLKEDPNLSSAELRKLASAKLMEGLCVKDNQDGFEALAKRGTVDVEFTQDLAFKLQVLNYAYKDGDNIVQPFAGIAPSDLKNWASIEKLFNNGQLNFDNGFHLAAALEMKKGKNSIEYANVKKRMIQIIAGSPELKKVNAASRMDEPEILKLLEETFNGYLADAKNGINKFINNNIVNEGNWKIVKELELRKRLKKLTESMRSPETKLMDWEFEEQFDEIQAEAKEYGIEITGFRGLMDSATARAFYSPTSQWFKNLGKSIGLGIAKKTGSIAASGARLAFGATWRAYASMGVLGVSAALSPLWLSRHGVRLLKPGVWAVNAGRKLFGKEKWKPKIFEKSLKESVSADFGKIWKYTKAPVKKINKNIKSKVKNIVSKEWGRSYSKLRWVGYDKKAERLDPKIEKLKKKLLKPVDAKKLDKTRLTDLLSSIEKLNSSSVNKAVGQAA